MKSQLFCGNDHCKYLSCNATCQDNNDYFHAGQMSLVHGGPGFCCLSPSLYQCILEGLVNVSVSLSDVYDVELKSSLEQLSNAKSADEANEMINSSPLSTLLDLAGTLKYISCCDEVSTLVQQTVKWFLLGRSHFSQEQFVKGLSVLGIYHSLLKNPESFRTAFCYIPQPLNADLMSKLFEPTFSEVGSNRHTCEALVFPLETTICLMLKRWQEQRSLSMTYFFFASDCKVVPAFGLKLFLQFLHHAEKNGEKSKLPKANTCDCILYLPVVPYFI